MATTENIANALQELNVVRGAAALTARKRADGIEVVGPWGSAKALVAAQLAQAAGASLLYLTAGRIESESALDDLCSFAGLYVPPVKDYAIRLHFCNLSSAR